MPIASGPSLQICLANASSEYKCIQVKFPTSHKRRLRSGDLMELYVQMLEMTSADFYVWADCFSVHESSNKDYIRKRYTWCGLA